MRAYSQMADILQAEPVANYRRELSLQPAADTMVLAIHGESIETGTSELALGVAGYTFPGVTNSYQANAVLSWYIFGGKRPAGTNSGLHITATVFRDALCGIPLGLHDRCISVHGAAGNTQVCYVGGLDTAMRDAIIAQMTAAGLPVQLGADEINGDDPANICNATYAGAGVQLEFSTAYRAACFSVNTASGRATSQTPLFWSTVNAIRRAL